MNCPKCNQLMLPPITDPIIRNVADKPSPWEALPTCIECGIYEKDGKFYGRGETPHGKEFDGWRDSDTK